MEPRSMSSMSLHPGHLFHRADNRGEVLVAPSGGLPGELDRAYLLGRRRDGYGGRQVHGRVQDQPEILEHQPERERGWICALEYVLQLGFLIGGEHNGAAKHLKKTLSLQTRLQAERDGFRQRLHAQSQQGVDAEFHRHPGTGGPHVERFSREHAQDRLASVIHGLLTTDEDDELSLLSLGRSEEHTSELQSPCNLVCRLLLEKKKK